MTGSAGIVIDPADTLPQLRAIDREALRLDLIVNGSRVDASRDADGRWIAALQVPRGLLLSVESTISIDGLLLARATQAVPVPLDSDAVRIDIPADSYNSNFDADNDRLSNLSELEGGSNPSDSSDPGLAISEREIQLQFDRPESLTGLAPELAEQARVEVLLNGEPLGVQLDGQRFLSQAMVLEESRIFVEATWFLDNPAALAVAGLKRSDRVTEQSSIRYSADSYGLQFDEDLDGVANVSEVRFQSDPTDAASRPGATSGSTPPGPVDDDPQSPPVGVGDGSQADDVDAEDDGLSDEPTPDDQGIEEQDSGEDSEGQTPGGDEDAARACAVSVFADGCDSDFDRDGIADSEEGRNRDADDDSIPDWMESSISDEDGDGTAAQFDVNEDDPCSPDAGADACLVLSSDTDGDGKLDSEEGDADRDGDGKPDVEESAIDDADDDETPDEIDPDDEDPCVPMATRPFCE